MFISVQGVSASGNASKPFSHPPSRFEIVPGEIIALEGPHLLVSYHVKEVNPCLNPGPLAGFFSDLEAHPDFAKQNPASETYRKSETGLADAD
jgi:hypothetical protein